MNTTKRVLDPSRSSPWFLLLLAVALVAFWPTYLSRIHEHVNYAHLHALTATLWIVLLIAQPLAVRKRRISVHRLTGQASYLIAPLVVASILLLAHDHLQGLNGAAYAMQTYALYLQTSLAVLFALSYGLAIANRRSMPVHARFMVCTAMTLIDPIVIRLMFWWDSSPDFNYNWMTFALTDLIFILLIALDWHAKTGRWVFPTMFGVFVVAQLPVFLELTAMPPWQAFASWFAALPLT